MAESITSRESQVFQCPNCREFINTAMTECSYCGAPVDYKAALSAAENQSKVARACSDANYLKIMARALVAFYLVGLIPFIGGLAGWGFIFLLIAIPVMIVRWWVKYSSVQTEDPDYVRAHREVIIALVIWAVMTVVWIAVGFVVSFILNRL